MTSTDSKSSKEKRGTKKSGSARRRVGEFKESLFPQFAGYAGGIVHDTFVSESETPRAHTFSKHFYRWDIFPVRLR